MKPSGGKNDGTGYNLFDSPVGASLYNQQNSEILAFLSMFAMFSKEMSFLSDGPILHEKIVDYLN